jgi:Transglycosylase SLT domain
MEASIAKQLASVEKQMNSVRARYPEIFEPSDVRPPGGDEIPAPPPNCKPMSPPELSSMITETAARDGLTPDLLRAVIHKESAFNPCAVSRAGAQGLMQLMPSTIQQFKVEDPFDPQENVAAGSKLLKQLLTRYGGDLSLALSA